MAILFDRREDGSVAFYIDGDLQFDSRDETVYHEALALPALALAERRCGGALQALICGGGDGLVARELLKSRRIEAIDLCDYDATVVAAGRGQFSTLNRGSLDDPRLKLVVDDAWNFVSDACRGGKRYDVIVCDFTVAQTVEGASLHSIEWYELMRSALSDGGVIAVNAVSPSATPEAYWSIYNSMRAVGLKSRPYRIALPSFVGAGYGPDWGFFLAASTMPGRDELGDDLSLAVPREQLRDPEHMRRMFAFPSAVAERRAAAQPAASGSGILLHYMRNAVEVADAHLIDWDGLSFSVDEAGVPPTDYGPRLLPDAVRSELQKPLGDVVDEESLFKRVVALMPALDRSQTRDMIAEFLENPLRFVKAIDVGGLVDRLLQRAAELPAMLVAELRLLKDKLVEFAFDRERLLALGSRVVTIVTLVVIVGNLIYPDAVYGKGAHEGIGTVSSNQWSVSRPLHSQYDAAFAPPEIASGGGFRNARFGRGMAVDESGVVYPSRRYYYYCRSYYHSYRHRREPHEKPHQLLAVFKLTPEADVLPDGDVAIALTDNAYLLLGAEHSTIVDSWTAEPILDVERDVAQVWRVRKEIERQALGISNTIGAKRAWMGWMSWLGFLPWYEEDKTELKNLQDTGSLLQKASASLGVVPDAPPPLRKPPAIGAVEIFSDVWMTPEGKAVIVQRPDGSLAYMNGGGWYRNPAMTDPLNEPYPKAFKKVVVAYLEKELKDRDATWTRLQETYRDAQGDVTAVQRDLNEYTAIAARSSSSEQVDYGTSEISVSEALSRTRDDLARAEQRAKLIEGQILEYPTELTAATRMIANLSRS